VSESRVERRERERREEERRRAQNYKAEEERIRAWEKKLEREELERERRKKKKKKGGAGKVVLVIILVIVGFLGFRMWSETRPGGADPIVVAGSGEFADSNRVNILFLGTNEGLADTIMVFSMDLENDRLDQISIPRDTYYHRPNYSGAAFQKINSVYSSEGYEATSKAVSEILGGVPIHYYAELKPDGVKNIVDAVGGVVMNVPMDMQYVDERQDLYIDLKAGTQLLSGDQAMQLIRFRSGYANGDLGRMATQQDFLKAALSQAGGFDLARVAMVARSEANTNMSLTAQAGFMLRARGMTGGSFYTHTIPGTTGMQDGLSYFFHDPAGTKELMRNIYASG